MKLQVFDVVASFYDFFAAVFRRHTPEKILSKVKPEEGDVLLDIGGGTGYNAARMKPFCGRLIVLDISFRMLQRARKHRYLELVLGDARMLPFKDKCFDVVMAVDSLHHVGDYPGVLREVRRTGKNKVFVAEFFGTTAAGKLLTALERFLLPVRYKRPDEFCRDASNQGITGVYDYVSCFEYFFLGQIER